eukprot:2675786-Pleurochrysis_carterae.AAC.1
MTGCCSFALRSQRPEPEMQIITTAGQTAYFRGEADKCCRCLAAVPCITPPRRVWHRPATFREKVRSTCRGHQAVVHLQAMRFQNLHSHPQQRAIGGSIDGLHTCACLWYVRFGEARAALSAPKTAFCMTKGDGVQEVMCYLRAFDFWSLETVDDQCTLQAVARCSYLLPLYRLRTAFVAMLHVYTAIAVAAGSTMNAYIFSDRKCTQDERNDHTYDKRNQLVHMMPYKNQEQLAILSGRARKIQQGFEVGVPQLKHTVRGLYSYGSETYGNGWQEVVVWLGKLGDSTSQLPLPPRHDDEKLADAIMQRSTAPISHTGSGCGKRTAS